MYEQRESMYEQRESRKYGSTYQPRQVNFSSSRRNKNGQRPFMSKKADIIMVLVLVVAAGVATMWFITRLPFLLEGASTIKDWAKSMMMTWGTPSMWWLFVNLIVGAIFLSSGLVSAFGGDSGGDWHRKEYIEKGIDVAEAPIPAAPIRTADYSEESLVDEAYRSYVEPAKPVPRKSQYTPIQPVYEATPYTDEPNVVHNRAEDEEIHTREISAPTYESLPASDSVPVLASPDLGQSHETAAESEGVSVEPKDVAVEPEELSSRSIPLAAAEPEKEGDVADQDELWAGEGVSNTVTDLDDGGTRDLNEPPAPSYSDLFTIIDDPPSGFGKLQRNFTDSAIEYIKADVRADVPLISAPAPKAELVKAHTFTSGRAIRRDQIDSFMEPFRKIEEFRRRDDLNRRAYYAEPTGTHSKKANMELPSRDTKPAKAHSRNSSVEMSSRDIPHSFPTEVFYPPPVQVLPAEIAKYFTSAHQAPPGEAELRQVTPAPGLTRPQSKKTSSAEVPERVFSKKKPPTDHSERPSSKKAPSGDTSERTSSKKTPADSLERPTSKKSSAEPLERPPSKKAFSVEQFERPETAQRPPSKKGNPVEGADGLRPKKGPAALEAIADMLQKKKGVPSGASERDQSKQISPEGPERSYSKQSSQAEGLQRSSVEIPIPAPPGIKVSPPPSPPASAPGRKQVSPPPPPPFPPSTDEEFSPPTSPPNFRAMPPPPPPHFKIPSAPDVKNPASVTSSAEAPSFNYYLPTEGRNPSAKQEAAPTAEVTSRSAKQPAPEEEVLHAPAPEFSSVRSFRAEPGPSNVQRLDAVDRPEQNKKKTQARPAAEGSTSSGAESEITEEGKPDDLHQKIEDFLSRMHDNLRLQRQESMARNKRISIDFND